MYKNKLLNFDDPDEGGIWYSIMNTFCENGFMDGVKFVSYVCISKTFKYQLKMEYRIFSDNPVSFLMSDIVGVHLFGYIKIAYTHGHLDIVKYLIETFMNIDTYELSLAFSSTDDLLYGILVKYPVTRSKTEGAPYYDRDYDWVLGKLLRDVSPNVQKAFERRKIHKKPGPPSRPSDGTDGSSFNDWESVPRTPICGWYTNEPNMYV
jgi:hypothetical protein